MAALARLVTLFLSAAALASLAAGLDSTCAAAPAGADGAESCAQVSAARSEAEIEQEEAAEIGAMEVRLLQAKKPELLTTARSSQPAAANASGAASATEAADASPAASGSEASGKASSYSVSTDHNGNLCLLCDKPKLERLGGKVYTEFRTDCGGRSSPEGPGKADLLKPVAGMLETGTGGGRATNAFCELNFAKSCSDAIANQDYMYWAKSLDFSDAAMSKNTRFDARYCHLNGFLERDVVALQNNFTGMRAKARELCSTKYAKYGVETLSFADMMSSSRYDDDAAPTVQEAELLAAWNCAMGDLGCDMAGCAYSFCSTSENTYGTYSECQGWHPVHGMAIPAATA